MVVADKQGVISLRQSMKELEAEEVGRRAAASGFAEALEASAAHVVEVNRQEAEEFREQVLNLAERIRHGQAGGEFDAVRSRFRGELQDYSEKARLQVSRLREELQAAGAAMQSFAQGVSASTGEHETVLRREFRQLEESAEGEDIRGVRAAVHETVHAVTESYEGLKQAQAVVITQLRDEIRVLQSELERGKKRAGLPPGVAAKRELDREIDELLRQDRPFGVVVAGVPDTQALYRQFPRNRVEDAITGMVDGLTALARQQVPNAVVAGWNEVVYGVVVTTGVPVREWQQKLASSHVFQLDGMPRTLRIAPRLEVAEHRTGDSPATLIERLSRISQDLTSGSSRL
jgi:hypothetical protein